MSHSRHANLEIVLLALVACLVLAFVLARRFGAPPAAVKAARAQAPVQKTPPLYPPTAQSLVGAAWRTDGGFLARIHIQNVLHVAPLTVTPTLYMADGTPLPLAPITIPKSGAATININQALANAPAALAGHISQFGSATLSYLWDSPGHAAAEMVDKDTSRSLTITHAFSPGPTPPMEQSLAASVRKMEQPRTLRVTPALLALHHQLAPRGGQGAPTSGRRWGRSPQQRQAVPATMPQNMPWIEQGLWWRHDPGVAATTVLANVSDAPIRVRWRLSARGHQGRWHGVELAAHETREISLDSLIQRLPPPLRRQGGVEVQQLDSPGMDGAPPTPPAGEIFVAGWMLNPANGFSADMDFAMAMPAQPMPITVAAAGLMVGSPMPGDHFPAGIMFHPYGYLRNATLQPLPVRLNASLGASQASAPIVLAPGETRRIGLDAWAQRLMPQGGAAMPGKMLNWSASYTGSVGDVVMSAGSVDASGSYVFEVMPQRVGPSIGAQLPFWTTGNGNNTMYSIWNPTAKAQDVVLRLTPASGRGNYEIPVHLAPGASTMVDLGMLRAEGMPDADGHLFPPGATHGSAMLMPAGIPQPGVRGRIIVPKSGFPTMQVIISSGVFNAQDGTCYYLCSDCCGLTNPQVIPEGLAFAIGLPLEALMSLEDCEGDTVDPTEDADWYADSYTAYNGIQPDGEAGFTGTGVGGASLEADYFGNVPPDPHDSDCTCGCPQGDFEPVGGVAVIPVITSISPNFGLVGTPKTVTVDGSGLTGGPNTPGTPAIAVSGSGVTATINSASDSEIQFTLNSTPGTSSGDSSFWVVVNYESSNIETFLVQIPTRVVHATTTCCSEGGLGPLNVISDGNFVDCLGGVHNTVPQCGVYRNASYQLSDQNGGPILDEYMVAEILSGFSTNITGEKNPDGTGQNMDIPAGSAFYDIQSLGLNAPNCLGANENDGLLQQFAITVHGGFIYYPTTVIGIARGYFSGTPEVNIVINTP